MKYVRLTVVSVYVSRTTSILKPLLTLYSGGVLLDTEASG